MQVFLTSTQLFLETRPSDVGAAVFDKDDALAVEFVTAASNLRALCYDIPTQSLFAAKVGVKDQRPAFCFETYRNCVHCLHCTQRGRLEVAAPVVHSKCLR